MTALPSGAVQIGSRLTFALSKQANVDIRTQIAVNNSGSSVANIGVYIVLDGNTSNMQDSYNKASNPGIYSRDETTTTILGLADGTHTVDVYAMTNSSGCSMIFTGVKAYVFYA